jgi:hypothetical protein
VRNSLHGALPTAIFWQLTYWSKLPVSKSPMKLACGPGGGLAGLVTLGGVGAATGVQPTSEATTVTTSMRPRETQLTRYLLTNLAQIPALEVTRTQPIIGKRHCARTP